MVSSDGDALPFADRQRSSQLLSAADHWRSVRESVLSPTPSVYHDAQNRSGLAAEEEHEIISQAPSESGESFETATSANQSSAAPSFDTCTQEVRRQRSRSQEHIEIIPENDEPVSRKGIQYEDTVKGCGYPEIPDPEDSARILKPTDLRKQRILFLGIILILNVGCACGALFGNQNVWVLCFILFVKSKDVLSVILSVVFLMLREVYAYFKPPLEIPRQWILTLIPTFSESEDQIVKTIYSLRDNDVYPHRQVMVVVLDGRPRDVRRHMTFIVREFERPYVSLKHRRGVLKIAAGFMQDVPVIVIEKVKNCGKKDSLVLCHDLFNVPRENIPYYTRLLRHEIWTGVLPILTEGQGFDHFDMVFCTDADSTIHKGAVASLANALVKDKNAIAACGLVFVEIEPGFEWSFWNIYQQFQYAFGQYVRRRAEGFIGKVTCLPGCITMIAVREEMAGAIRKYAEPVTIYPVIYHQVQYLGTDRRLTYAMLSQGRHLHTLFVPGAISETIAPQSLQHYLSQRRRWGSNAYFNNFFYCFGEKIILATRFAALIEVVRMTTIYYRIMNTCLFIKGLITEDFDLIQLVPLLIISQVPNMWFISMLFIQPELRKRSFKLLIGYVLNKLVSPFLSIVIFTKVVRHLGTQVWGVSGITASSAPAATSVAEQEGDIAPSAAEKGVSKASLAMTLDDAKSGYSEYWDLESTHELL
ncbi:glycosyltransferase family 2 protein [Aplosporella prunicola CBS 121167]|uniref:chitin synthase n=1 Tax=Aplosporella prunicola CBS 121167 TaxID=1176127 RepID=A0A6A6B3V5_9PEZI|nr:glycosyltransferase family 2 protein [Aplosporella prunicola CBS 121167]KAF2138288.1 glycosyltransferase family 2 protein [Aplosporella prunicola CBS 121167]